MKLIPSLASSTVHTYRSSKYFLLIIARANFVHTCYCQWKPLWIAFLEVERKSGRGKERKMCGSQLSKDRVDRNGNAEDVKRKERNKKSKEGRTKGSVEQRERCSSKSEVYNLLHLLLNEGSFQMEICSFRHRKDGRKGRESKWTETGTESNGPIQRQESCVWFKGKGRRMRIDVQRMTLAFSVTFSVKRRMCNSVTFDDKRQTKNCFLHRKL